MHPTLALLLGLVLVFAGIGTVACTEKAFDYIIIGGGTAGLVVATRLTEQPNVTVAIIEAGIYHVNEPLVDTPALFGQAIGNSAFDWNFVTVPQAAAGHRSLIQPRGKMLGGSSGLNFMAWGRASAAEYDAWKELGATGWDWEALLPYLRKIETVSPPSVAEATFPGGSAVSNVTFRAYNGDSGPLQSSYNLLYSNVTVPYVNTMNSLGIPTNSDPYAGDATGLYNSQLSIDRVRDTGRRSYAASTYYNMSMLRPNLQVFTSSQATKILFANVTPSATIQALATGVEVTAVTKTGFTGVILARKGVVLSAGTMQTPHLLELSGIGNETILSAAGIDTLIDLPGVGENFQDHPSVPQDFELMDGFSTFDDIRNNASFLAEQQQEYATNHTGFFASMNSALTFSPLVSFASKPVVEKITKQAHKIALSDVLSPLTKAQYAIQFRWLHAENIAHTEFIMYPGGGLTSLPPAPNHTYIAINTAVMHPFGRGSVHINSSDPFVPPTIDPRYLETDADLVSLLESLKFARNISGSLPLRNLLVGPHDPPANMTSDDDFRSYLQASLGSLSHPVGTAAMVPRNIGGVVDPRSLLVYGTSNLHVVDASLIPLQVAAHLQATVYAIAERASDIIKKNTCL